MPSEQDPGLLNWQGKHPAAKNTPKKNGSLTRRPKELSRCLGHGDSGFSVNVPQGPAFKSNDEHAWGWGSCSSEQTTPALTSHRSSAGLSPLVNIPQIKQGKWRCCKGWGQGSRDISLTPENFPSTWLDEPGGVEVGWRALEMERKAGNRCLHLADRNAEPAPPTLRFPFIPFSQLCIFLLSFLTYVTW